MQILKPLTIEDVGLATGNVMHMLSIDQMDFDAARFQDLKQRYPVDAGRFHRHRVHTASLKPVRQLVQILGESRKRSYRVGIPIGRYADKDFCRSNINTAGVRSHYGQTPVQLTMLPFLCFCHGLPPLVRQRARRAKSRILSSGIIATQKQLRVTNVIGHGPGIKLLNGLAEASTNGDATYAYRCRVPFLRLIMDGSGPMLKFLAVIGPARPGRGTPKLGGVPARPSSSTKGRAGGVVPKQVVARFYLGTTPSAPALVASRHFINGAATPPNLGVSRTVLLAGPITERKSAGRKQRTYRPTSLRGELSRLPIHSHLRGGRLRA